MRTMLRSIVLLVLLVLSPGSRSDAAWTAYNDMNWTSGQLTTNLTTNSPAGVLSGSLVDFFSGSNLAAQVTFSGVAGQYATTTPALPGGSDAATLFTNKLDFTGYTYWQSGDIVMTLSGLNPAKRYNFAMYGSRGAGGVYVDRVLSMVISDVANGFTNQSTAGTTLFTSSMANDGTRITADNLDGKLVWYTGINPEGNGTIVFTCTAPSGTNVYMNAFMLEQLPAAATTSAPAVSVAAATVLSPTSAVMNGTLSSTGLSPTRVWLYWKQGSDAGTNKASWTSNLALGFQAAGALGPTISTLASNTSYAYRYYASNGVGDAWSPTATSFTTPMGAASTSTVALGSAEKRQWYASTRRCGLIISEIMYNPSSIYGTNLAFVEIYNTESIPNDIGGWRLSGAIDYTFPTGTVIGARSYKVVAQNPTGLQSITNIPGLLGPFIGSLGGSGTLRLKDNAGSVFLEARYDSAHPWPAPADGAGHSLVLSCPDFGEGDIRSWSASVTRNGNPGSSNRTMSTSYALRQLRINEFLTHTDPPLEDSIEVFNGGTGTVDIGGCYLSDSKNNLMRHQIPVGTFLAARGAVTFTATQLGFSMNKSGGSIYLMSPGADAILDAITYEAQENGISMGRLPDGSGDFVRLSARTPNAVNTSAIARVESIVINEIMFKSIHGDDDDQYVELFNKSATNVNVGNWRFTDGLDFLIPAGTIIASSNYLVIARDAAHLLARYTNLNSSLVIGNAGGSLSGSGERLVLSRPDDPAFPNQDFVTVDEVTYADSWGKWSDGGGSSLELRDPRSDNSRPMNWADSDETQKAGWTSLQVTDDLDNEDDATYDPPGYWDTQEPPQWQDFSSWANSDWSSYYLRQIMIFMEGDSECLIDELRVTRNGSDIGVVQNPTLDSDSNGWILSQGNVKLSTRATGTGYGGGGCIHMVADGPGNPRVDSLCAKLNGGLSPNDTKVAITLKARWLKGRPDLNAQLTGNGLWLIGRLNVPFNLGTPGYRNSRYVTNAGPAIDSMGQYPILPPGGSNVTITARVHDPDSVQGVDLKWRLDPTLTYSTTPMNDSGTGADSAANDGIWSVTLPGQVSNSFVGFYLSARDNHAQQGTSTYPWGGASNILPGIIINEANIFFGVTNPVCDYGILRMLINPSMDQPGSSGSMWGWDRQDHMMWPCSIVYGDFRVIHNARAQLTSSVWTRGKPGVNFFYGDGAPTYREFNQTFKIGIPPGEELLGSLDSHCYDMNYMNRGRTNDGIRPADKLFSGEANVHRAAKEIGLYYIPMRYTHLFANEIHKSLIDVDNVKPDEGDYLECFFPGDSDGDLYSCYGWYEVQRETGPGLYGWYGNNSGGPQQNARIKAYRHDDGRLRGEMYRLLWKKREGNIYNNDLPLARVAEAMDSSVTGTAASQKAYIQRLSKVIDVENFARSIAWRHTIGDWDSFGWAGRNTMLYIPKGGKAKLILWDVSNALNMDSSSSTSPFFDTIDVTISNSFFKCYAVRRALWRGVKDMVDGPFSVAEMSNFENQMYAAHTSNNIAYWKNKFVADTNRDDECMIPEAMTNRMNWISQRVDYIHASALPSLTNVSFTASGSASSSSNRVSISGQAPVQVKTIKVNGMAVQEENVVWTSDTQYQMDLTLTNTGNNVLTFTAWNGMNVQWGATTSITVNFTGSLPSPSGNVVITEIMYDSAIERGGFVEIYNKHASDTYDLQGFRLNGVDFTFPQGSVIPPQQYRVVVASESVFYGNYSNDAAIVLGEYSGSLSDSGERISLERPVMSEAITNWIAIDAVGFDDARPWPNEARGAGYSLQLIDPNQDNDRLANWASARKWQYMSATGTAGNATLYLAIDNMGDVYLDDITLVSGLIPGVGTNRLTNGNFEAELTGWSVGDAYRESDVVSGLAHSGSHCLHLKSVIPNTGGSAGIIRSIPVSNGQPYALSFWYLPTPTGSAFTVRTSGSWLYCNTNVQAIAAATPGRANVVAGTLNTIPTVWINELMPNNSTATSIRDNMNEGEPWMELLNQNGGSVDFFSGNYYLTDDYDNMAKWRFGNGQTLANGSRQAVWCDAETNESVIPANPHVSFRLSSSNGALALVQINNGRTTVVDYINYAMVPTNKSLGLSPEGVPDEWQVFDIATPGTANNPASSFQSIVINEWLADNETGGVMADPADGDFDDWFELYNPNLSPVDVSGWSLTDDSIVTNKYVIPSGWSIPAKGFLMVWADNESGQTSPGVDLHASFRLGQTTGGVIEVHSPDGALVDRVTYGPQRGNVSEGSYPDGDANVYEMALPTPEQANRLFEVTALVSTGANVRLSWNVLSGRDYQIWATTSPTSTQWTVLTTTNLPAGTSTNLTIDVSISGGTRSFYRLIQK